MSAEQNLINYLQKFIEEDYTKKSNVKQIITLFFQDSIEQVDEEFQVTIYLFKNQSYQKQDGYWQFMEFCKLFPESKPSVCSKYIHKGTICFICHNCLIDSQSGLLCEQCFLSGQHKGHLAQATTDAVGACDCGDLSAIKFEGCCINHNPSTSNLLVDFNAGPYPVFRERLSKIFLFIKSQTAKISRALDNRLNKLIQHILELIGFILRSHEIMKAFLVNFFTESQQLLFELTPYIDNSTSQQLENLFLTLMKNCDNFLKTFANNYTHYFKFFFHVAESIRINHPIYQLFTQFFTEKGATYWTSNNQFHLVLHETTREIINQYFIEYSKCRFAYNAFLTMKQIYQFIIFKEVVFQRIEHFEFIKNIIDLGLQLQTKNSLLIEDEIEKFRLHIECTILTLFKSFLQKLQNLKFKKDQDQFKDLLSDILLYFYGKIKLINKELFAQIPAEQWPLHCVGFRMLAILQGYILVIYGFSYVKTFILERIFENNTQNMMNLIQQIMSQTLKGLQFSRLQDQKVGDFYELLSDPIKSMKIEIVNSFYKKSYYTQYDADIFLIQMSLSLLQDVKEFKLLQLLSSGIGKIDLKMVYFQHSEPNYRQGFVNILQFINIISTDMVCFANSISTEHNKDLPNIIKFLLINTFKISKVKDILTLKGVLFDKILNYEISIEQLIEEVAEKISNENSILRLKEEYQNHFDPFIFHKYTRLTQDLYEQLKTKNLNELILGGQPREYEFGGFEYQVLKSIFSDIELIRLLVINIKIDGFIQSNNAKDLEVLKLTLRLLGVYLRFSQKQLQQNVQVDHLQQIFLKPENEKKLIELSKLNNLSDLKPTIELLIKYFQDIKNLLKNDKIQEEPQQQKQKSQNQDKHIKRKQEKLKKQFLEKQNKFQKQNEELLKQEKQELVNNELCFYCREVLNSESIIKQQYYGIYGFISRDNISQHCRYYINSLQDMDIEQNKLRRKFSSDGNVSNEFQSYSISSCNHFVHRSCDEKNRKKQKNKKYLFSSPLEMLCGHCYFLSNIFVYVIDDIVTNNNQMELEFPEFNDNLSESIKLLFTHYMKNPKQYSPELKMLTNTFFDSIMQQLLQEEEIMTGDIKPKKDEWLLETMIQLLTNLVNSIQLSGLHFYARRDLRLYKNIFAHVKIYFSEYVQKNSNYYNKLLENALMDLIKIEDYINGGLFTNKSFQTLAHLEFKFFQQIILINILLDQNKLGINNILKNFITKYIRFLIGLLFIQYVGKKEPSQIRSQLAQFGVKGKLNNELHETQEQQLKEIIYDQKAFDLFMENEDFKSELIFYLLPIYRKCVGIFATFYNIPILQLIDPSNCSSDIEEIDVYTNFLSTIGGKELTILQPLNTLLQAFNQQNLEIMKFLRNLSTTSFSQFMLSPLPDTYHDFLLQHITVQCNFCNQISSNAQPYLCLICDRLRHNQSINFRVICSVKCNTNDKKSHGNLYRHTLKDHSGKCAFVHLYTGLVILNNNIKMIKFTHLYRDQWGQLPNAKKFDFKKFQLDRKVYNKVQDVIMNNRIPQEVTYQLMKDENILFTAGFM